MFYIIGLGLGDCKDITVKGLEIVKKCDRVYLEAYTSILTHGKEELEKFYGRGIIIADRELVEQGADIILNNADEEDVALLVVGDPFGATTHTDLILRAKEKGIKFQVIHNASILTAVGCCGLQLYNFGETVSIPFWTDSWKPDSFFDKIISNYQHQLHTLCLLDLHRTKFSSKSLLGLYLELYTYTLVPNLAKGGIWGILITRLDPPEAPQKKLLSVTASSNIKVKEPTLESLTKKKVEYMPPKFMSVKEAAQQLLEIIVEKEGTCITPSNLCVGLSRVGAIDQNIAFCTLEEMSQYDLGEPLHSLIIVGPELHPLETEYLEQFKV